MKIIIGAVLAVLVTVSVASAGQFGPPEPMADPGKFSFGVGYWFDQYRTKLDDNFGGTSTAKSNQYYMQGNYTFIKDWEVYGKLGGADLKVDNDFQDISDGMELYGTIGFKGVVYRYKNFAAGPFVEGSLYGDHEDTLGGGAEIKVKNQWDMNLGISAQYKVPVGGCNLTVYGGPFVYWNRAKSEFSSPGLVASEDMKENNNFGGFLGVKFPIMKQKLFLTAESQIRDKIGAGASISYVF